jgi:hypothetical protein
MAKMKWDNDIPWKDLHDEEFDEDDRQDYDGPIPPRNTLLKGNIDKMWLRESEAGNQMFLVLFVADGNDGEKKQYNGFSAFESVVFTSPKAKFKWQPWLDTFGITLKDIKLKTDVDEDDESDIGIPVNRVGALRLPAACQIITDLERKGEYKGDARIKKWLPAAGDEEEGEDYEEDEEDSF